MTDLRKALERARPYVESATEQTQAGWLQADADLREIDAALSATKADELKETLASFCAMGMWCTSERQKFPSRGSFVNMTEREIGISLVEREIDRRIKAMSEGKWPPKGAAESLDLSAQSATKPAGELLCEGDVLQYEMDQDSRVGKITKHIRPSDPTAVEEIATMIQVVRDGLTEAFGYANSRDDLLLFEARLRDFDQLITILARGPVADGPPEKSVG